jgi:hypothetical protein
VAINVLVGTSSTWTTTSNWSTGAAPIANQTVVITNSSLVINAGLDQHTIALAGFNQDQSFTGQIGTVGATGNTYLQIASPIINLGLPTPTGSFDGGSRLFNLDAGTTSTLINVSATANSGTQTGRGPISLLGTALTVNLTGGSINIAPFATETATASALNIASGGTGTPKCYLGPGVTLTTLSQNAGEVMNASNAIITTATITGEGSILTHAGTGGFATLKINPGTTVNYQGSGSINTLTLFGLLDMSVGGGTVHIGNLTIYAGAEIWDPNHRLVFDNTPVLSGCTLDDVTLNLGVGVIL